jgi:hypothetical protein
MLLTSLTEERAKERVPLFDSAPLPDGKPLFMLGKKLQGQVCDAARRIDLFLWIDATAGTCHHLTAADAKRRATALGLFGLPE